MDLVIYHKNCADGFGAALAAWTHLGDKARYIACSYGDSLPIDQADREGRAFILDFSFPRPELEQLAAFCRGVVILDHHKTAQESLANLPDFTLDALCPALCARFDMTKSGAVLAWEYFRPEDRQAPQLIQYIQDRDLWQWKLPRSREISAGLRSIPQSFETWVKYLDDVQPLIDRGEAVLAFQEGVIASQAARAEPIPWPTPAWTDSVLAVNATALISETCERILRDHPEIGIAACYFDRSSQEREWSLRSRDPSGPDVSILAKTMGGGGHKHAAGFKTIIKQR